MRREPICFICWDQGKVTPATMLCEELQKPLCSDHAHHCAEDGHKAVPLEDTNAASLACRLRESGSR
jgi:hypothetical protein